MYKNFFGLREAPFNVNPDPRYLYLTPQTRKALSELSYGINTHKGCILLTGEVGTGKTTLINCLRDWLQQQKTPTAFIFNCLISGNDLLEFILSDFGIPYDIRSKGNMLLCLNDWLVERSRARETPVLIVDEAQGLPFELLEEISLLLNIETTSEKLLQIVLAGQPELEEKIQRPELRQLRQRITVRCKTVPLTCEETRRYIQQRLCVAGVNNQPIFESAAMDAAYRYSGGIPRVLNLLCERALIKAYVDNIRPVPAYMVEEVAREFVFDGIINPDPHGAPAAAVPPDLLQLPSARASESHAPLCATPANVHPNRQEADSNVASGMPRAVTGESPVPAQNPTSLVSTEWDVRAPLSLHIPAESVAVPQPKQKERTSGLVIVPSESQIADLLIQPMAHYAAPASSAPHLVSPKSAVPPTKATVAEQCPTHSPVAVAASSSNRNGASRSGSMLMLTWNRDLDLWWSKNLSRQLCWKTIISTGLAGSILCFLALQMTASAPGNHFARFICGYLGLLFCAVSLGGGAALLLYSTRTQSQIVAKWSKLFASFLDWLRQPIHL